MFFNFSLTWGQSLINLAVNITVHVNTIANAVTKIVNSITLRMRHSVRYICLLNIVLLFRYWTDFFILYTKSFTLTAANMFVIYLLTTFYLCIFIYFDIVIIISVDLTVHLFLGFTAINISFTNVYIIIAIMFIIIFIRSIYIMTRMCTLYGQARTNSQFIRSIFFLLQHLRVVCILSCFLHHLHT